MPAPIPGFALRQVPAGPRSDVIEVEGLCKDYRRLRGGRSRAVDHLDLSVPCGGVFGLLGPNGSGKTTTIRCLMGLVKASAGRVRLLGADPGRDLHTVIGRVGCLVDGANFFPGLSARANLALLASIAGIGPSAVAGALDGVGLAERSDDLVSRYSLGMRQRLGIAAALLRDPELVILDEPANGLDPSGIREIRRLLRHLGDEGRTVVLASHQLAEVEQICDRIAILDHGRRIAYGTLDEVLSSGRPAGFAVRVAPLEAAMKVLAGAGFPARRISAGDLLVEAPCHAGGDVNRVLAAAGLWASELRPLTVDLESVFLELTSRSSMEAVS